MIYDYNKDEIKNSLDLQQVCDYIAELGGEPRVQGDMLICKTICHGGNSHKLYYYDNTKLCRCYTGCQDTFDIFELTRKAHEDWDLPRAIEYVAKYFGFAPTERSFDNIYIQREAWQKLDSYERISNISLETQTVELKTYDDTILSHLPRPIIQPWIDEGIKRDIMNRNGICFNPRNYGIVIPHYDINGNLVGIRERTLIKENEIYGKYRPAYLNNQLYNHPLSFNLYNLNNSKENIKKMKKAFVFEGEKSPLLYASYFGVENDISVACCGSSFIQYQAWLLMQLGVEEIIIAFDKQFKELNDDEHLKLVKNLRQIYKKYGHYVKISYMFDKEDALGYKEAPIDRGPQVFLDLFKKRINLYD